ncbi:unnamed protein product [Larinioides sclopetarius]|uniref:Uncharacterized protein n=1 Tax=Larinioides sclopetarius TaxID=280406 RepID=A0AAV2B1U6_9ARAC
MALAREDLSINLPFRSKYANDNHSNYFFSDDLTWSPVDLVSRPPDTTVLLLEKVSRMIHQGRVVNLGPWVVFVFCFTLAVYRRDFCARCSDTLTLGIHSSILIRKIPGGLV